MATSNPASAVARARARPIRRPAPVIRAAPRWAGMEGLVDSAEVDEVQKAEGENENKDHTDRDHGDNS
jgi:hypothetical protein